MPKKSINPKYTKKVGKLLKAAREKSGLTQKKIADMLGVTAQQISKCELGKNNLTTDKLLLLAENGISVTGDKVGTFGWALDMMRSGKKLRTKQDTNFVYTYDKKFGLQAESCKTGEKEVLDVVSIRLVMASDWRLG